MKYLKKGKNYHFCILYSLHIATIEKLNYKAFKLQIIKIFSPEFDDLISEITDLKDFLEKELDTFKYFKGEIASCLFFSEVKDNIDDFHRFLSILRPSNIRRWLDFSTNYNDYKIDGYRVREHTHNGYGIWTSIFQLNKELKSDDIFHLSEKDIFFVNRLINRYKVLSKKPFFVAFLSLYLRAYHEEADYFKFLLLFMIIESFIVDDDTTGVIYKIRRLCAVLVGANEEDCMMIYDKTRDAYNVRSKFVHSAKNQLSDARYLPYLHSLVCELGIMILVTDLESKTIFSSSNKIGFSQKQQLITEKGFKNYTYLSTNEFNFILLDKKKK